MTGEDLKARRLALAMQRPQFARTIGVAVRTLEDWESGRRRIARMHVMIEQAVAHLEEAHRQRTRAGLRPKQGRRAGVRGGATA